MNRKEVRSYMEAHRIPLDELEKVTTVYRIEVYIKKGDRERRKMLPMYNPDGTPRMGTLGGDSNDWSHMYLHPENIYNPDGHPLPSDIVHFKDGHTEEVFLCVNYTDQKDWKVETMLGRIVLVDRYESKDTESYRAWKVR